MRSLGSCSADCESRRERAFSKNSRFEVGRADVMPECREECEAHGTTEQEMVDPFTQGAQYTEFVGDLCATNHGNEGSSRIDQEPGESLHFTLQEPPRNARHECGRPDNRRVTAVTGAKCIVYVVVKAVNEVSNEFWIVGLLSRVEAKILHHRDARHHRRERLADRRHGETGINLALGPPQVAAHGHERPVCAQPFERRDRRSQAKVVGYLDAAACLRPQRSVEIGPNEHALPSDRRQILQGGQTRPFAVEASWPLCTVVRHRGSSLQRPDKSGRGVFWVMESRSIP